MRVWLITVGEPLPLPETRERLLRTGVLAESLAQRGHQVLWWTSAVDHVGKRFFVEGEPRLAVTSGEELQFLHGRLYTHNVSLNRLRNHDEIAARFRELSRREPAPDLVLCSFPTIELSLEAIRFGRRASVPVLLDVRDLWPDIFLDVAPRWARSLVRWLLSRWFTEAEQALAGATGLLAVSEGYLRWGLEKARRAATPLDAVFPLGYRSAEPEKPQRERLERRLAEALLGPDRPLIVFVGTFGRTYDLATVISAARLLQKRRGSAAHFVFAGVGDRERGWRKLARGVDSVTFLGWLSGGEVTALLRRSALGLAAYAAGAPQGIPNKVIEYLSAGLPVVSSLVGETQQLLMQNTCGCSYVAGDAVGLADVLGTLLAAPERRAAMREAASALFAARFTADGIYSAMADHLELAAHLRIVRNVESLQ